MKMKIIGHRGAAGQAPENTLSAIRAGIADGVYAVEFDVRLTRDRYVVLCHDADLTRVSGDHRLVSELTLKELQAIKLRGDERVPLLSEALQVAGTSPVIIEIKQEHMVRQVLSVLDAFPGARATLASFKYHEMALAKELRPRLPVYVASRTNPQEVLDIARTIGANGLDLNFWILNPLTYFMARRSNMDIMVYTIDRLLFARFIHLFYPRVMICTNKPQDFIRKRSI